MAGAFSITQYRPPGPVARAFINSTKPINVIQGPVGSGKTTASFFKALRYTALLPPCKDGIIRAKGAVVRADYRTLYSTTLESWFLWFSREDHPDFTGGQDRPAIHNVKFVTPRGRKIDLRVEFKALGSQRVEQVMRGWEGTWVYLNEVDTQPSESLDYGVQRTYRFPKKDDLEGEYDLWPCVIADMNAPPDEEHWTVKRIVEGKPIQLDDGREISIGYFRQPGGRDPGAENREHTSAHGYAVAAATMDRWQVHRMIDNKIGYDRSGMPVFEEFDRDANVADFEADPSLELHLGLDISGLHPAAVILQRKNLQFRVLDEVYAGRVHPEVFAEHLQALLQERYATFHIGASFYDPSNDYGADKEGGYLSSIDAIRLACFARGEGPLNPAPSNEIPLRLSAVRNPLMANVRVDGGGTQRALIIRPRCKMAIAGMQSKYHYRLTPAGGLVNPAKPEPVKNEHANVIDGLQYALLGLQGVAGAVRKSAAGFRPGGFEVKAGNGVLKTDFRL